MSTLLSFTRPPSGRRSLNEDAWLPSSEVDVVIPAFNEAARLPSTLAAVTSYLATMPWTARVIVVDNGSCDGTAGIVHTGQWGVETIVVGCAQPGKGAAVRRGLLTATAPVVAFVDADLATPIESMAAAVEMVTSGVAAVIGSRRLPDSGLVVLQPPQRRLGGAVFRHLVRPLVPGVADTQCGFKVFNRTAVQEAVRRGVTSGFMFDVELLRHIRQDGGVIVEVPVEWTDGTGSTFRPVRDGLASLVEVARLYRAVA